MCKIESRRLVRSTLIAIVHRVAVVWVESSDFSTCSQFISCCSPSLETRFQAGFVLADRNIAQLRTMSVLRLHPMRQHNARRWIWLPVCQNGASFTILHALGVCKMQIGWHKCSLTAGVERWLLVLACIMILILALVSDAGLQCASGVRIQPVRLSRLMRLLLAMVTKMLTYVDCTLSSGNTPRGHQKRKCWIGGRFAVLTRCLISSV